MIKFKKGQRPELDVQALLVVLVTIAFFMLACKSIGQRGRNLPETMSQGEYRYRHIQEMESQRLEMVAQTKVLTGIQEGIQAVDNRIWETTGEVWEMLDKQLPSMIWKGE